MNWEPTQDRIIVERLSEPQGRIVLTDAPKYRKFIIRAVGPGKWDEEEGCRRPMESHVGDIVVLPGIAAEEPDKEIGDLLVVREGDIGWKIY